MSAPLHPVTLAAHLKGKGFARAEMRSRSSWTCESAGFVVERDGERCALKFVQATNGAPRNVRAELESMLPALAPEFEVAEDYGGRVIVRRAVIS